MENVKEGVLLGIGNPLLDISATVDISLLTKYGLQADGAVMANDSQMPLYKEMMDLPEVEYIAGGSVMNSVRVVQWVLGKGNVATYFGCVGRDKYADILKDKATEDGVNVRFQYTESKPTGTCAVLLTGTQRSLCANLAAATQFTPDHLADPDNAAYVNKAEFFYASGFFLASSPESVMTLARHALAKKHTFIMNLSAPFVSQIYKQQLEETYPYVDILFGNETETLTFGKEFNLKGTDLKELAKQMCQLPKLNDKPRVVIVTQGNKAVLLAVGGVVTEIPVTKLSPGQIVDTNGAGDAFTGGFLAQLILKKPLETCVACGIYAATHIIQHSGCTYTGQCQFA